MSKNHLNYKYSPISHERGWANKKQPALDVRKELMTKKDWKIGAPDRIDDRRLIKVEF